MNDVRRQNAKEAVSQTAGHSVLTPRAPGNCPWELTRGALIALGVVVGTPNLMVILFSGFNFIPLTREISKKLTEELTSIDLG